MQRIDGIEFLNDTDLMLHYVLCSMYYHSKLYQHLRYVNVGEYATIHALFKEFGEYTTRLEALVKERGLVD